MVFEDKIFDPQGTKIEDILSEFAEQNPEASFTSNTLLIQREKSDMSTWVILTDEGMDIEIGTYAEAYGKITISDPNPQHLHIKDNLLVYSHDRIEIEL